jgi:hypothetical protein
MNKEKQLPPSETRYDDLVGVVSINLHENQNFDLLASQVGGFDPAQFEAVALRVFIQETPVITLYAREKASNESLNTQGKLLVHKFKVEMGFEELFSKFRKLNFTVTAGDYNIENMEVVNA